MNAAKAFLCGLLEQAEMTLNGPNPWDPQVHNEAFYPRVLRQRSLGLGEAYMDGWWDCQQLDEFFHRLFCAQLDEQVQISFRLALKLLPAVLLNAQSRRRAFEVGQKHYDIGNDLYERMLDGRLTYTCGYWRDADTLDEAQTQKLDLVCRKLGLKQGQTVLDIGCGWGSFCRFAAENYGASALGVTVSKAQVALGRQRCRGLPVELRLQDYRALQGRFDHIVSLGMFEHVGYKNYRTFFEVAHRCLEDDGLLLLHTIGANEATTGTDPWIDRYIFPNSTIPTVAQVARAVEGLFVVEDWHNFGMDYDKTLMAWHANFARAWPQLRPTYGERFGRMWRYFLLASAALFRSRKSQLWQVVLSKRGVPGGYRAPR